MVLAIGFAACAALVCLIVATLRRAAGAVVDAEAVGWVNALSVSIAKQATALLPSDQQEAQFAEVAGDLATLRDRPLTGLLVALRYVRSVPALREAMQAAAPATVGSGGSAEGVDRAVGEPTKLAARIVWLMGLAGAAGRNSIEITRRLGRFVVSLVRFFDVDTETPGSAAIVMGLGAVLIALNDPLYGNSTAMQRIVAIASAGVAVHHALRFLAQRRH